MAVTPSFSGLVFDVRTFAVADPAAGSNFVVTNLTPTIWGVSHVRFTLTTAVAVATRIPILTFDDGVSFICHAVSGGTQPASIVDVWSFSVGTVSSAPPALGGMAVANMGNEIYIPVSGNIQSAIQNLQAADQISGITVTVKRWIAGL